MKIVGLVPARGGSRGIPRKNLAPVGDRPLLAWTVQAALEATSLAHVVVSSDDKDILAIAAHLGADALHRPAALSSDLARAEAVALHTLNALDGPYDALMLLQPTSPLRTARDIDAAAALMSEQVNAVISVTEPEKTPFKAFYLTSEGYLAPVAADQEAPFRPRQTLPKAYFPNGAIYLVRTLVLQELGSFLPATTVPYPMPASRSLDVDTLEDLEEASLRLGGTSMPDSLRPIWPATETITNFFKV